MFSMARIFFDTEFLEDGKTIELLSIGMVRDDGEQYYAVVADADWERANAHQWLAEHVIPNISHGGVIPYKLKKQIAEDVIKFAGDSPEFWADYSSYDWVALCQLFGTMMDLPKGWPMFCRDVQQYREFAHVHRFPQLTRTEHNALTDAQECKTRWLYCESASEPTNRAANQ